MTDQELIKAAQSALNGAPVEFIVGARCLMPILSERIAALSRVEAERDAAVKDLKEIADDTGDGCQYCKHLPCVQKHGRCIGFEWRGAQGADCNG